MLAYPRLSFGFLDIFPKGKIPRLKCLRIFGFKIQRWTRANPTRLEPLPAAVGTAINIDIAGVNGTIDIAAVIRDKRIAADIATGIDNAIETTDIAKGATRVGVPTSAL